jgi:hypothetical protein
LGCPTNERLTKQDSDVGKQISSGRVIGAVEYDIVQFEDPDGV